MGIGGQPLATEAASLLVDTRSDAIRKGASS